MHVPASLHKKNLVYVYVGMGIEEQEVAHSMQDCRVQIDEKVHVSQDLVGPVGIRKFR